MIFYLNGIYNIDKDIIVTEQKKDEEIILHFGNKEHCNKYSDKNSANNLTIKKIKKNKYLGYNKLIKDYNSFVGCKKYSVYHILSVSKNSLNKNNDGKIKISSKKNSIEEVDKTNFYDEKKQLLLFNDVASQASSIASSTSKSVFIYNNKGNKKVKNENDIINKFKIIKITLIITLFVFFGLILFQCIYLIKLHEQIDKRNNIFLLFFDYTNNFYTLTFSVFSLICLAYSPDTNNCFNSMNEITKIVLDTNTTKNNSSNIFLNFTEFIYAQNELLYQNLQQKLDTISKSFGSFGENDNMLENFIK
jgi:hypothetical protein